MAHDDFSLDPRLAEFGHSLTQWDLSLVLLARDANYPWLILVPRVTGVRDLHELTRPQRLQLMDEIARASEALERAFQPDKLNVANLGNQVPQLHVHIIARFEDDRAWPHPVWGREPAKHYAPELLEARSQLLRRELREA